MPTTYRIKDWHKAWENAATRKLTRCPEYIKFRTDQRSEVFRSLIKTRDGLAAHGVFMCLVQLAASCVPERGTLARSGVPYDADTCAGLIGGDRATFRRAWPLLIEKKWLIDRDGEDSDVAGTVAEIRHDDRQDSADDGGDVGGNPPPNPPTPPTVSAIASHGFSSRARNGTVRNRNGTDTATATARDGNAAAAEVSPKGEKTLSDVRRLLLGYGVTPGERLDAIEASGLTPAEVRAIGDEWRRQGGTGTGVLLAKLDARIALAADTARRKEAARAGREWVNTATLEEIRAGLLEYADEKRIQIAGTASAQAVANSEGFAVWVGERKAVTP